MDDGPDPLIPLALQALHLAAGARLVPFAGHAMPVQYPTGIITEHLHTRAAASLFDVSHMGQVRLWPTGSLEALAQALEALMPIDALGLLPGRQRYGLLTGPEGGTLDDLMIAHRGDHFLMVVNAANKAADLRHLTSALGASARVEAVADRCLLALQGPAAERVLEDLLPGAAAMRFMDIRDLTGPETPAALWVARSGYTGEDGYEISVPQALALAFAEALLRHPEVRLAGLGARDTLRLEAGLPLHGQDLSPAISPVEAGLGWAIPKVRRTGGARAGGFAGAARILRELDEGPPRRRAGLIPEGRAPLRDGTPLFDETGAPAGIVTSGGFGPSVGGPISMGLVRADLARPGVIVTGEVRGRRLPARVTALPFHPTSYKR